MIVVTYKTLTISQCPNLKKSNINKKVVTFTKQIAVHLDGQIEDKHKTKKKKYYPIQRELFLQ